ncbi:MAG: glutaredoxin family protein [Methylococcales bacterium]
MPKAALFLLIALLGGLVQHQAKIKSWLHPLPPLTPGSYQVLLYSTVWCGYCAKTREYFADNHIDYQDIDVEKTEQGRTAYQQLGANGVPIVVINNDTVIRGFAPDEIAAALQNTTDNATN